MPEINMTTVVGVAVVFGVGFGALSAVALGNHLRRNQSSVGAKAIVESREEQVVSATATLGANHAGGNCRAQYNHNHAATLHPKAHAVERAFQCLEKRT